MDLRDTPDSLPPDPSPQNSQTLDSPASDATTSAPTVPAPAAAWAGPAITGPMSIGDLLDRIFRLYRARFGVLVLTAAVLMVPLALISGTMMGQFMVGYMDFVQNMATSASTDPGPAFGALAGYGGVIFFVAILSGLVSGMVNLAVSVHGLRFYEGETLTVVEGLRRALPRLWHVVLLYIVQFSALIAVVMVVAVVVILLVMLVGLAVGGAAMFLFQDSEVGGPLAAVGLVILFICGYLFLLALMGLPVLYLSARWIVAVPALVNEGLGPVAALRRSWQLSKGSTMRTVLYLFLLFVLSSLVVSIPLAVIQQILLILPIPVNVSLGLSTALGSLFNIVWQPLYAIGLVLLYYDLRVRRESYDVARRIDQLEQEVGAARPAAGV
ncbi:MAG: glycerophosphoryl diester phosphodiesterase membrane domain-containing protein [Litorilinea sp.]